MAIFDPMIYYAVETVTGFPEVHEGPSLSTIQAMSFTRTFTISVHSLGNTSNGTRQSTFALILAPVYFYRNGPNPAFKPCTHHALEHACRCKNALKASTQTPSKERTKRFMRITFAALRVFSPSPSGLFDWSHTSPFAQPALFLLPLLRKAPTMGWLRLTATCIHLGHSATLRCH